MNSIYFLCYGTQLVFDNSDERNIVIHIFSLLQKDFRDVNATETYFVWWQKKCWFVISFITLENITEVWPVFLAAKALRLYCSNLLSINLQRLPDSDPFSRKCVWITLSNSNKTKLYKKCSRRTFKTFPMRRAYLGSVKSRWVAGK